MNKKIQGSIQTGLLSCLLVLAGTLALAQTPGLYHKVPWHFSPNADVAIIGGKISQEYPFLQAPGMALELERDLHSPGGRHLQFRQSFQGKPIYQAGIRINLDQQGRTTSILPDWVSFSPGLPPDFQFDTTGLAARMGETASAKRIYVSAQYLPENGALLPIYRIETESVGAVASYEILLDGITGAELQRTDLSAYFHPPQTQKTQSDTVGYGRVFQPDPCTRAELAYGVLFTDNNDAHTPELEALMDTVQLQGLTYQNGQFLLEGPNVKLVDRANFTIAPVTSADGTFFFTRDHNGFEDVMVYYHIDHFHRYVESLGFTNLLLNGNPIQADPHGKGDSDQSAFIQNNGNPYLLYGDGGVDDAEDADVIIHEYGHALSNAASLGANTGQERRGLDEGIGDYFAATYSLQTSTFDGQNIFNWDGHNEFWSGRIVNSTLTYPPASNSIYAFGEIWVSTLMQIYAELGDTITDRLVLQSLYSNAANITLRDAARIFLDADSLLYAGEHTPVIQFYFCERGLFNSAECIQVPIEPELPALSWTVAPNPSQGQIEIHWESAGSSAPARVRIVDLQGRICAERQMLPGKTLWSLDLPAGLYLLQLQTETGQFASQKLLLQTP